MIEPKPMLRGDWSAVVHGGVDPAELAREGMTADGLLDFSANLNPFGPSPAVAEAIRATRVDCYPDRQCRALQQRLAERLRVEVDEVMLGNGSVELIYLLAGAYVSVGERVLIVGPAFAEYERACRLHGGEVAVVAASPAVGFAPPLEEVAASLSPRPPRLVFINTPNNPTGQVVPRVVWRRWAADYPQTLWVLDEAYLDCLDDDATTPADSTTTQPDADVDGDMPPNVLRLRSLTKAHGLAGLRLGYALARRHILAPLRLLQPPWSVNALAQAAGLAVLADTEHLQQTRTRWHAAKRELVGALVEIGLVPVPSAVPFFLVRVPNATRVRERLLHRGLLVRDAASFGLVDHLRICARGPSDNRRLVQALAELRREAEGWGG